MKAMVRLDLEMKLLEGACVNEALRMVMRDLSLMLAAQSDTEPVDLFNLFTMAPTKFVEEASKEQIISTIRGLMSMVEGMLASDMEDASPGALMDYVDGLLTTGLDEQVRVAQELKALK